MVVKDRGNYDFVPNDWIRLESIINDLSSRILVATNSSRSVLGLGETDSPTFKRLTLTQVGPTLSPLAVTSQAVVTNLNANFLQGHPASDFIGSGGETDPLSIHLAQPSPAQTMSGGVFAGSGLLKITSGLLGVDTSAYYKSGDNPTFANITDSGLTITRIPYTSTAGLLIDSSNLTFNGTDITCQGYGAFISGLTLDSTAPTITGGFFRGLLLTSILNPIAGYFSVNSTRNSGATGSGNSYGFILENYWRPTVGSSSNRTAPLSISEKSSLGIVTGTGETKNYTITDGRTFWSYVTTIDGSGASGIPKITTAYNYYAATPALSTLGQISTCYAFYDAGQTVGTQVTNPWGLGINTKSYINANLSVGKNTAPAYPIDCVGDISSSTLFRIGAIAGINATVAYVDTLLGAKTLTFVGGILTAQV